MRFTAPATRLGGKVIVEVEAEDDPFLRARAERSRFKGGRTVSPCFPGSGPRNGLKGSFCLMLVGLAAVGDPALREALAQGATAGAAGADPLIARLEASVQDGLDGLGPACGLAIRSGNPAPPCGPDYRDGILAQVASLQEQMEQLFVDPAVLGAGPCRRPGEAEGPAKVRLALVQGGNLALYDRLAASASALQWELASDGYVLSSVGGGLVAGGYQAYSAGGVLAALAAGINADAYELYRISAASRTTQADVTLAFDAEDWKDLESKATQAAAAREAGSSSAARLPVSTGAAGERAGSTGAAPPVHAGSRNSTAPAEVPSSTGAMPVVIALVLGTELPTGSDTAAAMNTGTMTCRVAPALGTGSAAHPAPAEFSEPGATAPGTAEPSGPGGTAPGAAVPVASAMPDASGSTASIRPEAAEPVSSGASRTLLAPFRALTGW